MNSNKLKQTQFTISHQNEKFLAIFPRNEIDPIQIIPKWHKRTTYKTQLTPISERQEKNRVWAQSKDPRDQEISPSSSSSSSKLPSFETLTQKSLKHSTPPPVSLSLSLSES
jgi:hypothetical protein